MTKHIVIPADEEKLENYSEKYGANVQYIFVSYGWTPVANDIVSLVMGEYYDEIIVHDEKLNKTITIQKHEGIHRKNI